MNRNLSAIVTFSKSLPQRSQLPADSILFYDGILANKPVMKAWLKKFKHKYALRAGETLKTIDSLQQILKKMSLDQIPATTQLTFIAAGGGSVGDFVGFLSSIFLRGRPFIQIPSTWLAAVDSAHGGKNGLNFDEVKNQLGTIYLPKKIFIAADLLKTQPAERLSEAFGEVIKISLINAPQIFIKLESHRHKLDEKFLFQILPDLIQAKMKIVKVDPLEKKGFRRVLNLGHTLGHVLESHFKLPHGEAVKLGTLFSARWSFHKGYLKDSDFLRISNLIQLFESPTDLNRLLEKIDPTKVAKFLSKDKKSTKTGSVDFIFIKKIGQVHRESVRLTDIIKEVQRQKVEF